MKKLTDYISSGNIAEIEVAYKTKVKPSERLKVSSSNDAYAILKDVWSDKLEYVEEFVLLLLNRANKVLGWVKISQGGIAGTIVDPKVVFQIALSANACGIILAHNHPSGSLYPSSNDLALTKKIVDGAKLLDMTILDHVIITTEGFYSFADEGKI